MYYLYLDHELIACSTSFSEIYNILFCEIYEAESITTIAYDIVLNLDELLKNGHCSWYYKTGNNVRFDLYFSK